MLKLWNKEGDYARISPLGTLIFDAQLEYVPILYFVGLKMCAKHPLLK